MKRGSVIFDESGFLSEQLMKVFGDFAIVDKSLRTGKSADGHSIDPIRQRTFPTNIPNQKIYVSSASDVTTPFYKYYRDFAKKQIEGDPDFCVMHIDCTQCFHPTLRGEVSAPLLTKSQVDADMRQNRQKSLREYYCIFTTDGGTDAIIRRGTITKNQETRKPVFSNETGDKKYIFTYDPARMRDNSVIAVWELYYDLLPNGDKDYKLRLVNCVNLMDVGKKIKSPMQIPDQVDYLRKMVLAYNGNGDESYNNIVGIWIDAGAGGGGGQSIADLLMQDWTSSDGVIHRGLIDREYSKDYVGRFPNAVDKLHLMQPTGYKSLMYEAFIDMMNQNKIKFTASYDHKGYLTVFKTDYSVLEKERKKAEQKYSKKGFSGEKLEEKIQEDLDNVESVNSEVVKLDWMDELALVNIDAMKQELVNIVRKKRESGKDSFELAPDKARTLHDDRAYVAAMGGWAISQIRRENLMNRQPQQDSKSLVQKMIIRRGTYNGRRI